MQTTRGELLTDFLRFVTELGDAEARNVAETVLNRAIETIWMKHDWNAFRSPQPYLIPTTANQARYALPDHFGRLGEGFVRNLTRGYRLRVYTQEWLDRLNPANGSSRLDTQTGPPWLFLIEGTMGVHTQPTDTAGWTLEALSDDSGDTDVVVSLRGENANGDEVVATATLTGTTAVALGTFRYVDDFGKSFAASVTPGTTAGTTEHTTSRGTVTLRRTGTSTELQRLLRHEAARHHQQLQLYPTPDATYTIAVPIFRAPKRLLYDGDPLPFGWKEAVFEEMVIQWRVNTGELTLDQASSLMRPALLDLLAQDRRARPRPRKTAFGAGVVGWMP